MAEAAAVARAVARGRPAPEGAARRAARRARARDAGRARTRRARPEPPSLRRARLAAPRAAPGGTRRALVRHRSAGAGPVRARPVRAAPVAPGERAGERGEPADRHRLRGTRRLRRRAHGRAHDARRRRAVFTAVPVHRHHPHEPPAPRQSRGAVPRPRGGGLADERAHRARPDARPQAPRVHRGGAGARGEPALRFWCAT